MVAEAFPQIRRMCCHVDGFSSLRRYLHWESKEENVQKLKALAKNAEFLGILICFEKNILNLFEGSARLATAAVRNVESRRSGHLRLQISMSINVPLSNYQWRGVLQGYF
jgi:hypothetical protein